MAAATPAAATPEPPSTEEAPTPEATPADSTSPRESIPPIDERIHQVLARNAIRKGPDAAQAQRARERVGTPFNLPLAVVFISTALIAAAVYYYYGSRPRSLAVPQSSRPALPSQTNVTARSQQSGNHRGTTAAQLPSTKLPSVVPATALRPDLVPTPIDPLASPPGGSSSSASRASHSGFTPVPYPRAITSPGSSTPSWIVPPPDRAGRASRGSLMPSRRSGLSTALATSSRQQILQGLQQGDVFDDCSSGCDDPRIETTTYSSGDNWSSAGSEFRPGIDQPLTPPASITTDTAPGPYVAAPVAP